MHRFDPRDVRGDRLGAFFDRELAMDQPALHGYMARLEGSVTGLYKMQPVTVTNCLSGKDLKSLGPLPDLVGLLARGCESTEYRVEGERIFLKFACEDQSRFEITGRAGEENFSGEVKLFDHDVPGFVTTGSARRAGACEATNEVDALLGRARHYAQTEDGVGIVLIEGKKDRSEMATS